MANAALSRRVLHALSMLRCVRYTRDARRTALVLLPLPLRQGAAPLGVLGVDGTARDALRVSAPLCAGLCALRARRTPWEPRPPDAAPLPRRYRTAALLLRRQQRTEHALPLSCV